MVGGNFNMAFLETSDDGSGEVVNAIWAYKFSFWFSLGNLIIYLVIGGKWNTLFKLNL